MLRDRLTAKFLSSNPRTARAAQPDVTVRDVAKSTAPAAIDTYSKRRQLPSTVWI